MITHETPSIKLDVNEENCLSQTTLILEEIILQMDRLGFNSIEGNSLCDVDELRKVKECLLKISAKELILLQKKRKVGLSEKEIAEIDSILELYKMNYAQKEIAVMLGMTYSKVNRRLQSAKKYCPEKFNKK